MKNDDFVLLGIFYDKYQFEQARDILTEAGIEFRASNRAPSVNFRVPGSAFTEIEILVEKENLEKAEKLLESLEEK
jgi:hypothetical protein